MTDKPAKDSSKAKPEDQAPDVTEDLEQAVPVVEAEEPSMTILDEAPVTVLDPPVDPDPLDDELSIPEDPAPAPTQGNDQASKCSEESRVIAL